MPEELSVTDELLGDFNISLDMSAADTQPAAQEKPQIDPEDDRENWPTIYIDFEEGKGNFEFITASGTKRNGAPFQHDLQIQRGVNVKVPPSAVHNLRDAVSTQYRSVPDPAQGGRRNKLISFDKSALPWQLVDPGKYIRR